MNEEWRPVVNYEGIYSVSSLGRVRRELAGKGCRSGYILRPTVFKQTGYLRVGLVHLGKQATRTVHSLVAEAFVGPCPSGFCVNHKDGIKITNIWTNLEYISLGDNNRHARAIGLCQPRVESCCYGHPYDGENTIVHKNGDRDCRRCARRRNSDYKKRKRLKIMEILK